MLATIGRSAGFLSRFFTAAVQKTVDQRCEEVFQTIIRPVLLAEGSDVTFHGVKDECAIITLYGMADTIRAETADDSLPEEILEVLQVKVPEIKYIRKKHISED
jgi:Fe-S cluster biogenesis protein NfuA